MRRQLLSALTLVVLMGIATLVVGCATPYQPYNSTGGYHDFYLGNDSYFVSFSGNGYTSTGKTEKYALYRAAQIAHEHGYDHFIVLEKSTEKSKFIARVGQSESVPRPVTTLTIKLTWNESAVSENGTVYRTKSVLNR